jgi:hypothetical protein
LKPENVKVNIRGDDVSVKVVDVGFEFLDDYSNNQTRFFMGQPLPKDKYPAIDVALRRSDIVNFGLILYSIVTGRVVSVETLRTSFSNESQVSSIIQRLPEVLRPILKRCLFPEATSSIPKASEVRELLSSVFD